MEFQLQSQLNYDKNKTFNPEKTLLTITIGTIYILVDTINQLHNLKIPFMQVTRDSTIYFHNGAVLSCQDQYGGGTGVWLR